MNKELIERLDTLREALSYLDMPNTVELITEAIAALSQQSQEPVARLLHWCGPSHYPVPHGGIAARTYSEFSKAEANKPYSYWKNGAELYTAPAYGVHEGMRSIIVDALASFKVTQSPNNYRSDHWSRRAEAITRAADQVNAEGQVLARCETVSKEPITTPDPSAPQSSQPDTVAVPRGVIKFLCGESSLDGVEFGDDHPKFPGKYWWRAMLRTAQEGKK